MTVRNATPVDDPQIRAVLRAAYEQFAPALPPAVLRPYQADLLDLEIHPRHGTLVVAEAGGRIQRSGALLFDSHALGFGWPAGWSGGRGLAVRPPPAGTGVVRALLGECERMAITVSAPVFAFHTARFVAAAVQLYEHLGYQRAPWRALRHPRARADPLLAYRRDLVGPSPIHTHRSTRFFMPAEGLE